MADYFHATQHTLKTTGPGGWTCTCCMIASRNPKTQAKNKAKARRRARRVDKQKIARGDYDA